MLISSSFPTSPVLERDLVGFEAFGWSIPIFEEKA
jgi:hypothetical protein